MVREVRLLKEQTALDFILGFCSNYCSSGSLVIRDVPREETQEWLSLLNVLQPYVFKQEDVTEWPGTKLLEGNAILFRFRFNLESASRLRLHASSLFDFIEPYPEDLCLYRADGSPLLISIAHERDAYLELSQGEFEEWINYSTQRSV